MPRPSTSARVADPQASPGPRSGSKPRQTVSAETLAAKQRDISVSEFFAKNRHLLGFDNPRKALLTTVKEAVDNSLDACEEAGILPDITVVIEDLEEGAKADKNKGTKAAEEGDKKPKAAKSSRYRLTIVDNGPGIVRKQVEHIFGRLLYGSKFHRLKMSRGQQGIGISAAGMYGLITTGKPMMIQTRPDARKKAHHIELAMNTKTNRAEVTIDEETDDFPLARLRTLNAATRELAAAGELLSRDAYPTGTSVTIELEGKYQRGRGSVDEFLELTAIANPHARITLVRPTRTVEDEDDTPLLTGRATNRDRMGAVPPTSRDREGAEPLAHALGSSEPAITEDLGPLVVFPRAVGDLPRETREIQPHPKGVELGTLLQMLKDFQESTKNAGSATLYTFLQEKFSRVSASTASEFCQTVGVTSRTKVADLEPKHAEALYKAFQDAKLAPPPTDCLAPIGVQQLLRGMFKGVRAEFYAASSREPEVYRGRPFLIEAAIAFGGDQPADDAARVIRFANRVPLLYQQSACSAFKAAVETAWKNYGLPQPRGSLPQGALVIMIHMASVWVPFTSESKEAIADYDEIRKEMKLALMECGRKLGTYLKKRQRMRREAERRDVFERYIGEISKSCGALTGVETSRIYAALLAQAKRHTAIADATLDDEGRIVREQTEDDAGPADGVLIVGSPQPAPAPSGLAAAKPTAEAHAGSSADAPRRGKLGSKDAATSQHPLPAPAAPSSVEPKPTGASTAVPGTGRTAKPRMRLEAGTLKPVAPSRTPTTPRDPATLFEQQTTAGRPPASKAATTAKAPRYAPR